MVVHSLCKVLNIHCYSIDPEFPQVSFNSKPNPNPNPITDLSYQEFYKSIRSLRLPTQLLHINKTESTPLNAAKKVSEKVIQLGSEMTKEKDYEYLIRRLSLNEITIQHFHGQIIQDFTLVHKCYNLSVPINTTEDKPVEEGSVPFFVNRTSRKNSSNFRSLYVFIVFLFIIRFSHRKTSRLDASNSNSSTVHSFATDTSDSGIIDYNRK